MKKSARLLFEQWFKRVGLAVRKAANYVCPYCQKQAGFYGEDRVKEFGLDPMLNKIGCCINPLCLNSTLYPRGLADKKTWKIIEVWLEKMTGFKYGVLACPKCKQWTLRVLDDSAPGAFVAECSNASCGKKLLIQ